jgi:N-acyl-D-amino-acid deacylase
VHASHLWGLPAGAEAAFGKADAAGVGITYDMYPYRKSSTILAMLLLPFELQAQGPDHTLAAITNHRQRSAILADEKFTDQYLARLTLGCLPEEAAGFAGQTITEAAARESRPPGEWVLDLLASADRGVGAHLDRPELSNEDLAWLNSNDRHCAGSDGIYQGQRPHPRGFGAFAQLAEFYVAGGAETGYQRLARHLAATAADTYGLRDRGRLAPGMAADIAVIGPAGITARATYDAPVRQATGVGLVLVNGVIAWRDGQPVTTGFPGKLVS